LRRRNLIYCLFALLLHSEVNADIFDLGEHYFETIGDNQDIPSPVITAIAQDKTGFMWFGTQGGLIRFDGYTYKLFTHIIDDPTSIAGDYITTLWAAPDGKLWIGTANRGLSVYDSDSGTFSQYRFDESDIESLSHNKVRAIVGDDQGGVWIGTQSGLNYLPANQSKFLRFNQQKNGLSDNKIYSLLFSKDQTLWVGTGNGVNLLDKSGTRFDVPFQNEVGISPFEGQTIWSMTEGFDGRIWLGTKNQGAHWLIPGEKYHTLPLDKTHPHHLSHPWVFAISQVNAHEIWLATYGGGISIFDTRKNQVVRYARHNPSNSHSINLDDLGALFTDSSGLVWIGTWGNAINRTNPKNAAFRTLHSNRNDDKTLTDNNIGAVLETDTGQIWVGTAGNGIDIIDPTIGVIDGLRETTKDKKGLQNGVISALVQSDANTIWIGTLQAGVYRYQLDSKAYTNYKMPQGLDDNSIRVMVADKESIWIGTNVGLNKLNLATGSITPVSSIENKNVPLKLAVEMIVKQKDQTLWVNTESDLYVLPANAEYLLPIRPDPLISDSLSGETLRSLSIDNDDRVWVPTQVGIDRLVSWDGATARFEFISKRLKEYNGNLPTNFQFDKKGNAWGASAMLDLERFEITQYGQTEGVDIGTTFIASSMKTQNGKILFNGTSGLLLINPEEYQAWDFQPPLTITEITVNNQPINIKATQSLVLEPGTKGFTVEFAALDYSAPKQNQYSYKLDGYDDEWIETDSEYRVANYTNLDPGNYHLMLRGSNRMGQWSSHKIDLAIIQQPAWYQTLWLKLAVLLLSAALLVAVYKFRLRQLERQKRALKKLVARRTSDISMLSQIGRDLTSTLSLEQVTELVYKNINRILDAHVFLIGIVEEKEKRLHIPLMVESEKKMGVWNCDLSDISRPGVWCVNHNKELVILNQSDRKKYTKSERATVQIGQSMVTIVYQPLIINDKTIGCMSIQNLKENAYDSKQLAMFKTLASYAAIAVSNALGFMQLAQAHEELETQNLSDQLTGVYNRRFLAKFMPNEISSLRRNHFKPSTGSNSDFGFLLIDVDYFKHINDTHGHDAGDKVLVQFVEVIKKSCRETDWIIRWGGEEFLIVARFTHRQELHRLAERIRVNVEKQSFDLGNKKSIHRTCSIGIAVFPFSSSKFDLISWEQTVNFADLAMYAAKTNGRNAWVSLYDKDVAEVDSFFEKAQEDLHSLVEQGIVNIDTSLNKKIKFRH